MKISHHWLEDYFDKPIPSPEAIAELLTMHAFEIESVDKAGKDSVLDVKVLPDRSHDCLSHRGIALEVSLLADIPVKDGIRILPTLSVPESNVLKVEVEDTKLCKRFSALVIENVEVKESPKWLAERLEVIGHRSINNIVDATNYVMFSLGQPLHAYDRTLLKEEGGGWKIVVRKAKGGEKLMALDNKEYSLTEGQLVIVDGNSDTVLGIAGIKGGKASEISKSTKSIILEAANFESVNIRKTAKALGLRTDASVRFENEITPELTMWALQAVSDLIFKIAGTDETQAEGMVDVYPREANPYKLGVSLSDINNTLGLSISEKEVSCILDRFGFAWTLVQPRDVILQTLDTCIGVPYKYSASVSYDAPRFFGCSSLVNYAYIQGGISLPNVSVDQYVYGEPVEESQLKPGDIVFSHNNSDEEAEFELMGTGEKMKQKVHHIKTFEFMPGTPVPEGINHNYIYVGDGAVIHASSTKKMVVRDDLETIKKTQTVVGYRTIPAIEEKRFVVTVPAERVDLMGRSSFLTSGIKENLIEEIGRVYGYENIESKPVQPLATPVEIEKKTYYGNVLRKLFAEGGYSEVITYAFQKNGVVELANPIAKDRPFMRVNLMGGMEESRALNTHNADLLGLAEVKIFEIGNVFTEDGEHSAVAFIGGDKEEMQKKIETALSASLQFTDASEFNLDTILSKLPEPNTAYVSENIVDARFKPFSQYPFVLRDIAVFVPEGENESDIIDTVKKEAGNLLVNFRLFDTFTKDFDGTKKTSYAYRLVFQSTTKTLSDEEINPIMEKATKTLNAKANWLVR